MVQGCTGGSKCLINAGLIGRDLGLTTVCLSVWHLSGIRRAGAAPRGCVNLERRIRESEMTSPERLAIEMGLDIPDFDATAITAPITGR
jgi:hypothetical protein